MAELNCDKLPQHLLTTLPEVAEGTFPLRLSAFEKYLLWDETPIQPMTMFIEMHFIDPIQVDVMEMSISAAAKAHPLLTCTIEERDGDLHWIHHPDSKLIVHRDEHFPPLDHGKVRPFDLKKEFGVRFWYRTAEDHYRLMFQVHHAVTDGVGMRRFMIDAITLYAHATNASKTDSELRVPWSKLDPSLLQRRADFTEAFGGPPAEPLTAWQRLKNAYYFHFQLPKPLRTGRSSQKASVDAKPNDKDHFEPLEHLVIDRPTSFQITEKARMSEIGISDLALALLFETCCLWNQQHGDRNPKSRIRLLLPYDLRSRMDLRMPATNRLSFSFLGRTQADCCNLDRLISSIADEVRSFGRTQLPLDFMGALESAAKNPRLMRWAIRRSRNMATAVLTYVGDTSRAMQRPFPEQDGYRIIGDARLDKILGAPPVRDNTNLSVGLCINWGQLCISAAWNRANLTRQQAAELLALYKSRWLNWLGTNCEPG